MEQLVLNIRLRADATFHNFYEGPNARIVRVLQSILDEGAESFVYFWGPRASGRTHLLHAMCQSLPTSIAATYLPLKNYNELTPDMLHGLERQEIVALDDVHCIAGNTDWEEALFHLYNRMQETGARLVMTGDCPPAQLPIVLADLKSRLTTALIFHVYPLSDEEKINVLQLHAKQRGMVLSDEIGRYLLQSHSRDLSALLDLLSRLDEASLVDQRKLTLPFVRGVL